MKQRVHARTLTMVGASGATALLLAACSAGGAHTSKAATQVRSSVPSTTPPQTYTMSITVNDNNCLNNSIRAAYDGVPASENTPAPSFGQVVVKDDTEAIIGTGTPTPTPTGDNTPCTFTATVPGLPQSSFYDVAVGSATQVVSFAQAQSDNWQFSTTLGTIEPPPALGG